MRAAWIAKKFDGKAAQYFGFCRARVLRSSRCRRTWRRSTPRGAAGPGVYLVNTYDLPTRPLYNLTALTLHESAPGHAFQMPIAMEHKDQPEFRQHTYISAYGEGWALYCEKLGLEMGMYETPYDRFGMFGYQIWRAARLVVDTGIHSQGWTREQAIAYLRRHTALPEHEIDTEVDRYIAWPGAGAVVLPRRDGDREGARQGGEGAGRRDSTSAPSMTRCWSWGRCRCRCSRRASTASSPRAARARIRIWSSAILRGRSARAVVRSSRMDDDVDGAGNCHVGAYRAAVGRHDAAGRGMPQKSQKSIT